MQYESFATNDGTNIAYQTSLPLIEDDSVSASVEARSATSRDTCILLLHGFSGSSEYFTRNTPGLTQSHWVIAPDMRGHGRSQQTPHGYHVARLAMDLYELVQRIRAIHLDTSIYPVGCSIGAAVLWTYVELFSDMDFRGFTFVDQAPLQDRSIFGGWGDGLAHYGCYDEATTLAAQKSWASGDEKVRAQTCADLVKSCLGYRYARKESDSVSEEQSISDEQFFTSISRICDGKWLAQLIADHTQYDHREAIELISKPVLVMAGARSGCFSIDGMTESVTRAKRNPKCTWAGCVTFDSGHWLFWEEPEKFNKVLLEFVSECEIDPLPES